MSEFIGKLTPQSPQMIRLGGEPGLSGADISQAAALGSRLGYLIIQRKFGDDRSGYDELCHLTQLRISEEAKKEHWKIEKIAGLVKLAVNEYTGNVILTDRLRALSINTHPSNWSRVWSKKYRRVLEVLEAYEQSTLHLIKNRLK